ncbi:hypothetical protein FACS1894166_00490 [Bacilli bacterium]|nr:hypothetical protein FACS1894166_00490 [Bacilli bacterium]
MSAFKNENKAAKYFKKNKEMEPMENPEFDKLFPCQRNDEVQFRTLFSPLAQEEMVKLLKVKNDYNFYKSESLNVISAGTFNEINMNYNFDRYYSMFDYEDIKKDFYTFNQQFFKDIYFMFAPILTIPIYIQSRYRQPMDEKAKIRLMSYMESESVANTSFNQTQFSHPNSKTESILKTHSVFANTEYEINEIIAHGYDTKSRVVVVTVVDPEAGATRVPITVIDYLPIQQSTYVSNALAKNIKKDFNGVFGPLKSVWDKYSKSLGATALAKHGNFVSLILGRNKPDNKPDTYKKFLDDLSKTIGQ